MRSESGVLISLHLVHLFQNFGDLPSASSLTRPLFHPPCDDSEQALIHATALLSGLPVARYIARRQGSPATRSCTLAKLVHPRDFRPNQRRTTITHTVQKQTLALSLLNQKTISHPPQSTTDKNPHPQLIPQQPLFVEKIGSDSPRWLGSKKFAIPSLILYSCPQFPHTSFPSRTSVSRRRVCNSRSVFSSAGSKGGSVEEEGEEASARAGRSSGFWSGSVKPSCLVQGNCQLGCG